MKYKIPLDSLCILVIMCFFTLCAWRGRIVSVATVDEVMDKKVCYLTFDDGPSLNTEKILNILEDYGAKATFFVIGAEITKEDEGVMERIIKEGHAVGLHSYVHRFEELYVNEQICLEDYKRLYNILQKEYGIQTKLIRFPGGSACSYMNGQRESYIKCMRENGFRCFDWNVSGEDSVGNPTVYSIQNAVFSNVDDYATPIILLHDSGIADKTVEALPGILEYLTDKGYEFETLELAREYIYR